MTIKHFITFAVFALLIGVGGYFGQKYVSRNNDRDTLLQSTQVELSVANHNLDKCRVTVAENERDDIKARLRSQSIANSMESVIKSVDVRVSKMNPAQKKVAAKKGLVAQRLAPEATLADTSNADKPSVQAGESTDDALVRLTKWVEVYQDSTFVWAKALADYEIKVDGLEKKLNTCEEQRINANAFAADKIDAVLKRKLPLNINLGNQMERASNEIRGGKP